MIFYAILFLLCIIFLFFSNVLKTQTSKNIIIIFTLIVLCLVSRTRYILGGSDYFIYERLFESVPDLTRQSFFVVNNSWLVNYEKGYLFLNSVIKTIGFNFYGFTLIHAIIFYVFMYIGLKKYIDNFSLLIMIFLYKLFFYNTFISLRQSIAVAIFFLILKYIQEKKPYKYFIGCMLAMSFHNAALILFPIYFINRIALTKNKIIFLNVFFLPTIMLSYVDLPILKILSPIAQYLPTESAIGKIEYLTSSIDLAGINLLHTFEYVLIMFLLIISYEKVVKINKDSEFIIKLFLCLIPIFTLLRGYTILTREKDFLTFTFAMLLNYLCQINKKKYSLIIQTVTIIVCAYGFFRFITLFDNGGMMPYDSYLFSNISIFQ